MGLRIFNLKLVEDLEGVLIARESATEYKGTYWTLKIANFLNISQIFKWENIDFFAHNLTTYAYGCARCVSSQSVLCPIYQTPPGNGKYQGANARWELFSRRQRRRRRLLPTRNPYSRETGK